jgi:hypothetical protein
MTTTLKVRTTAPKTLALFMVLNLAFACTYQNQKPNEATTNVAAENKSDTIIIIGVVQSITNGKDGYTADVRTAKEGTYAALVSIVNVAGPRNYKSCEMGDTVTFEGILTVLDNVRQLKVTKIISVSAANTEGGTDLAAKYSKIQKNEYCWQTNKALNLHKQPDAKSKVEGKHFAGEVLKVLGTKTVNNQLWVNVTYTFAIKAGYEDQFADGQVHPSGGLPTGWIGGAEVPKINCK